MTRLLRENWFHRLKLVEGAQLTGSELIRIKFDGGLASSGQLHFYEYSRSQYAMARFIATVEHFRRTGKVTQRITVESNVDVIVRSPQQGSFIEDLLVPAIKDGIAAAVSTPLSAVISYVFHLLAPRSEKTETTVEELAKIRKAELEADVAKAAEHTRQLEILASIIASERASSKQALDLLDWSLKTGNTAIPRLGLGQSALMQMRDEVQAEVQREQEFEDYREQLESLDEDRLNRLTSRLRPMVSEIALPLRRSADKMSISHGEKETTYAHLDLELVRSIQNRESEEHIVEVTGHVRSYDRDSGIGKITSNELHRVLNFVVPISDRVRLRDQILNAMRKDTVVLLCRRIVDQSGLPTSLILIEVDG